MNRKPEISLQIIMLAMVLSNVSTFNLQAHEESPKDTTSDSCFEIEDQKMPSWRQGLHWFFACGDLLTLSGTRLYSCFNTKNFMNSLPEKPLSPELKASLEAIIGEASPHAQDIIFKSTQLPEGAVAAAIGNNAIVIDPSQMENASARESEFIIRHELAHLEHGHNLKQGLMLLALPCIAHFGLKAWDSAVKSTLKGIKKTFCIADNSRAEQFLKKLNSVNHWLSTFCLTKCVVAWQLFYAYSRYCEKQADLQAVKQMGSYQGAHECFKHLQEIGKKQRNLHPINTFLYDESGDVIPPLTHPRSGERIAYTQHFLLNS
ncbi:MAG: M48 family metalloprotease [Candidatus Babeliales bacterium]